MPDFGKSERVVSFIANLMPSYHGRRVNGDWAAESLDDGTLILPIEEGSAKDIDYDDAGFVRIFWQGDRTREAVVVGDYVATIAVVRHVNLHYAGQPADRLDFELEGLAAHYHFKTGGGLYLPYERVSENFFSVMSRALGRLGEAGVIEVLKKAAGF